MQLADAMLSCFMCMKQLQLVAAAREAAKNFLFHHGVPLRGTLDVRTGFVQIFATSVLLRSWTDSRAAWTRGMLAKNACFSFQEVACCGRIRAHGC